MRLTCRNFYSYEDGVDIESAKVQEMIDKVVDFLLDAEVGDNYTLATGNTIVFGVRYIDEISVVISQDYKEANILLNDEGEWEPIDYEREKYSEYSRQELIDMLLKSDYNPRKEV